MDHQGHKMDFSTKIVSKMHHHISNYKDLPE